MPRCLSVAQKLAIKVTNLSIFRDHLLFPPPINPKAKTIGKNDEKSSEKPEKKEKKAKEMSESRVKKFHKLFGKQVSSEERLINYFSCALVADILLQGHLYVSEHYFSFYSNVFGFITKLVIPIPTVTQITKEKTAKFFPNAIALKLSNDGKHVFGSFLSREAAYQLMSSIHRKTSETSFPREPEVEEEEVEADEEPAQDVEVSSLEDSSSIGSASDASPAQLTLPLPLPPDLMDAPITPVHVPLEPIAKLGNYNVKLMSEGRLLFVGICLTVLLAIFSVLLLLKINSIERHSHDINAEPNKLTIDDAERILNRNVLIVRNVREKLEALQDMLQNSFDKMPNGKQEL